MVGIKSSGYVCWSRNTANTSAARDVSGKLAVNCAYNGHFGCTCYHPLFCFNQFGEVEQSLLREGNVHSAKNWRVVLEPVVARYQGRNLRRHYRADAAFAHPELHEYLEAEGFEYAIRLPANDALLRDIKPLLTRPVGRPSNTPVVWYAGFL